MSPSDPYTPRDLFLLARVKEESAWDHTAQITAAIINTTPGRKKAVAIDKLNPVRESRRNMRSASEGLSIAEAVRMIQEIDHE